MLVGESKSQVRGEVEDEDELVEDINDTLPGELEHDSNVEMGSPGSKEVCSCVEVDVLGESGGSHSGQSNRPVSFFLYLQSTPTA